MGISVWQLILFLLFTGAAYGIIRKVKASRPAITPYSLSRNTKSSPDATYRSLAAKIVKAALIYRLEIKESDNRRSADAAAELVYLLLHYLDRQAFDLFGANGRNIVFDNVSKNALTDFVSALFEDEAPKEITQHVMSKMISTMNSRQAIYSQCKSITGDIFPGKGTVIFAFSFYVHKALGHTDRDDVDNILKGSEELSESDIEYFPDPEIILNNYLMVTSILHNLQITEELKHLNLLDGDHNASIEQVGTPSASEATPSRNYDTEQTTDITRATRIKWLGGITVAAILVLLINAAIQPTNSITRIPNTQPSIKPSPMYKKPPAGTDKTLSVEEIRWCLRSAIELEAKREYTTTDWETHEFNSLVEEYNQRCVDYYADDDDYEQALSDVENIRLHIIALARGNFSAITHEAQSLLTQLGYNPGPIDGIYGGKTKSAIEQFERDVGLTPRGEVTDELGILLKQRIVWVQNNS